MLHEVTHHLLVLTVDSLCWLNSGLCCVRRFSLLEYCVEWRSESGCLSLSPLYDILSLTPVPSEDTPLVVLLFMDPTLVFLVLSLTGPSLLPLVKSSDFNSPSLYTLLPLDTDPPLVTLPWGYSVPRVLGGLALLLVALLSGVGGCWPENRAARIRCECLECPLGRDGGLRSLAGEVVVWWVRELEEGGVRQADLGSPS